jgi:hypothetical protein
MADIYPRDSKKRKFEKEYNNVMSYYLKKMGRRHNYREAPTSEKIAYSDGLENGLTNVEHNERPENDVEYNDDPEEMFDRGLEDGQNARLNPTNSTEREYLSILQTKVPPVSQPEIKVPPKPVETQIMDEFKKLHPLEQSRLAQETQLGRGSYLRAPRDY